MRNFTEKIKANNSIITLESGKTKTKVIYKIEKHKKDNVWFIQVLESPNDKEGRYLGYFKNEMILKYTSISRFSRNSVPAIAMDYFLRNIKDVPKNLYVSFHNNKCIRCGRELIDPKSIENRMGRECYKKYLTENKTKEYTFSKKEPIPKWLSLYILAIYPLKNSSFNIVTPNGGFVVVEGDKIIKTKTKLELFLKNSNEIITILDLEEWVEDEMKRIGLKI